MGRLTIAVAFVLLGAVGCNDESGGDVTPDSTAPPVIPEGQVLVPRGQWNAPPAQATNAPEVARVNDGSGSRDGTSVGAKG